MSTWDVVAAQLVALRAQVDGLYALVEEERAAESARTAPPAPCSHPETEDAGGTFGIPRRRCTTCREIVTK